MALNFLADEGPCKAGVEFTARMVLRIGVALLGMRITLEQMAALGWKPMALVVILVVVTIGVSVIAARLLGFVRHAYRWRHRHLRCIGSLGPGRGVA